MKMLISAKGGRLLFCSLLLARATEALPHGATVTIFGDEIDCPTEDPEYCAWHGVATRRLHGADGSEVFMDFTPKKYHSIRYANWTIVRTSRDGGRAALVSDAEVDTIAYDRALPLTAAMFLDLGSIRPSIHRVRERSRDWLELNLEHRSVQFADGEAASFWPIHFELALLWRFPTENRLSPIFRWPVRRSNRGRFTTYGPFVGGFAFSGRGEFRERDGLALGPQFELTRTETGLTLTARSLAAGLAKQCRARSGPSASPEEVAMDIACARWRGETAESVVERVIKPLEARAGEEIPFLRRWVAVDLEQR